MFAVSVSPATVSRVAPGLNSKSSSRCVPHARSTQSIARAGVTNKVSRMFGSIQTKSLLSSSTKRVSNVQSARHAVVPTASAPTGKGAKIIVQGIHLEVTDSIKEYCEQKINKAVSHFDLHDVREVDVRCSARGGEKQLGGDSTKTTVSVYTKNGVIRAEDEGSDLYASIDAVADKLERKLRKLKEKKKAARPGPNKNNPKAATAAAVEAAAVADVGMSVSVSEDEEWQETVTERFQAVRACTAGDAAEEMEQLGNTFYAFKNIAQNGEVCVVYKRSDGGYGVVVPVDMD